MYHLRVAIIGEDDYFINTIIGHFKEIIIFQDWHELERKNSCYDLLIINIYTLKYNGFCVFERVRRYNINKQIFILVNTDHNHFLEHKFCPINYINNKVSIKELEVIIKHKFIDKERIESLLKRLGMPYHIKGYIYLSEILNIKELYSDCYSNKNIYKMLSDKFNTNEKSIERAIRNAIEISWTRSDYQFASSVFGNTLRYDKERPTNKEYISAIISFIKRTVH
jgi:hypothetical protein